MAFSDVWKIFRSEDSSRLRGLVSSIKLKHKAYGIEIHPPASAKAIRDFEKKIGFLLPVDFKNFYSICNGFGCTEDIFNIIPLHEITIHEQNYGQNWFYFSEYMIYCDMWLLEISADGTYTILNASNRHLALTNSLIEFLERFLRGNVFDRGGLYDWQEELKAGHHPSI